jgi:hypothetical protein
MNKNILSVVAFVKVFFTAGSSRSKYICLRAVASHLCQTSGNKVIVDTNTTHAGNECECARRMHGMCYEQNSGNAFSASQASQPSHSVRLSGIKI